MAKHEELLARHQKVLPKWLSLYYEEPISLVDGSGRHVVDAEGNRYLDFFGGILTTSIGYNLPEFVEAVQSQAARMVHTSTLYLIEQQIELAERLAALSGILDAKVFFTNSGTEANEAALLFATALRHSNEVLALRNSYHGRSFGAMGVTANHSWSASSFSPLSVHFVQSGYRYRSPFSDLDDEAFNVRCADDLRDLLATSVSRDVACMIVEPIQGVGGFVVPPDGYLGAIAAVLSEAGIPLVSDEVQTAWGRTGTHFWGVGHDGVTPAAMTFAKGLANGLPIGGVIASAALVDSLESNSISTFGGNPLSTAAALVTLEYLEHHRLQDNAKAAGEKLLGALRQVADDDESVGEVRGRGLMVAVEFVVPGTRQPDAEHARRVTEEARRRGLLVGRGGMHANVLRLAPPMSVTAEEVELGSGLLGESMRAVAPAPSPARV